MKYGLVLALWLTTELVAQPAEKADMTGYLLQQEKEGFNGSVLVADKGKILLESGFGFADREKQRRQTSETVFSTGSVTKQFTAAAILKLEEEGLLSVKDPLKKYLKTAPPDKQDITLHQLLTHTAGLAEALGGDYDTINAVLFLDLAMKEPLVHEPGTQYLYSNVGYSLLGILVERISGMGYEQYLHDKLFVPAGMKQTGYLLPKFRKEQLATGYRDGLRWGTAMEKPWLHDGPGWHLRANGGILSTTGDMYRWYLALSRYTVLMKTQVEKLFTPHVAESPDQRTFYAYGWVVQPVNGMQYIWHNGGNGVYNMYIGFNRAGDRCCIVSSNTNQKISDRLAVDLFNMLPGGAKLPVEGEFDYRNNPVTNKILEEMNKGAAYFSAHADEILKEAGFDFANDMPLLGVGEALEENRRWDEATALYETYTRLFPRIVVAWNRLGKCYEQKGEMEKARQCWTKSVALRSHNNPAAEWLKNKK